MAEELQIAVGNKEKKYETLVSQISALVQGEKNLIATLANTSAAIHMTFGHLWVGFYLLENDELVLGPFQGPVACTRIPKGKGVCGSVWETEKTIIVKNVNQFPGHISCSSSSLSEIVVPLLHPVSGFFGVLDLDSSKEATFDQEDQKYLEQIAQIITHSL